MIYILYVCYICIHTYMYIYYICVYVYIYIYLIYEERDTWKANSKLSPIFFTSALAGKLQSQRTSRECFSQSENMS